MRRLIVKMALAVVLTFIVLLASVNSGALTASLAQQVKSDQSQDSNYFTITGFPNSVIAGQSFSGVTVAVYNSSGIILANYTGQVYFTSTDPKATVPYTSQSNYTFTIGATGDNGVHTFSGFNLVTAGSQTITVTDGSISASTNSVTVNPASPTVLQITPKTATITAGSAQSYTATATDYFGNSWSVSSSTLWFIDSGAQGSWSGNVYTSAKAGVWTVTGVYDGLFSQVSLTVNQAASVGISINPETSSVSAGSPVTFTAFCF